MHALLSDVREYDQCGIYELRLTKLHYAIKTHDYNKLQIIDADDQSYKLAPMLKYILVSPRLVHGFVRFSNNIASGDACHLTGQLDGVMLCITMKDGDSKIFPVLMAISVSEDRNAWVYVLNMLYHICNARVSIFISDRGSGVEAAKTSEEVRTPSGCIYRNCTLHIARNTSSRLLSSPTGLGMATALAKSATEREYTKNLETIAKACGESTATYLHNLRPTFCTVETMKTVQTDYGITSTNMSEQLNNMFEDLRGKPFTHIVREFTTWLYDASRRRYNDMCFLLRNTDVEGKRKPVFLVTPAAVEKVKGKIELMKDYYLNERKIAYDEESRTVTMCVVNHNKFQYEVSFCPTAEPWHNRIICKCMHYNTEGLPCKHAAIILAKMEGGCDNRRLQKMLAAATIGYEKDFVWTHYYVRWYSPYYHTSTVRHGYESVRHFADMMIPLEEDYQTVQFNRLILPFAIKLRVGRKRVARYKTKTKTKKPDVVVVAEFASATTITEEAEYPAIEEVNDEGERVDTDSHDDYEYGEDSDDESSDKDGEEVDDGQIVEDDIIDYSTVNDDSDADDEFDPHPSSAAYGSVDPFTSYLKQKSINQKHCRKCGSTKHNSRTCTKKDIGYAVGSSRCLRNIIANPHATELILTEYSDNFNTLTGTYDETLPLTNQKLNRQDAFMDRCNSTKHASSHVHYIHYC